MSQATGFSRAFAFFLSGFQGFSSKRHSERFSSSGLPMGTPDETWGVNSLTIAVVCESWLWQSRSSRRAEPCQDGRQNSRGVFWKGSCRRSSELYSYEGSVLSRFGPHRLRLGGEGPPRDSDLLPRRRHTVGFFSCVACPPVLLILRRAASSFFTTFLSSFVGPSVIRLSRQMADGSSPLSSISRRLPEHVCFCGKDLPSNDFSRI